MPGPESARASARTSEGRIGNRRAGLRETSSEPKKTNASKSSADGADERPALVQTIARELSLRERLVVCLRYVDGLTLDEIAIVLNARTAEIERILSDAIGRARRLVERGEPRLA
jgi:DNA-directed RNA polymerase specialized sigma subunit